MGKYTKQNLLTDDLLEAIANELAEANRLKRQELVIAHLGEKPDQFKRILDMLGSGMDV